MDRDWAPDVARTLGVARRGSRIRLYNVRNFDWHTRNDFSIRWETSDYDLDDTRGSSTAKDRGDERQQASEEPWRRRHEAEELLLEIAATQVWPARLRPLRISSCYSSPTPIRSSAGCRRRLA